MIMIDRSNYLNEKLAKLNEQLGKDLISNTSIKDVDTLLEEIREAEKAVKLSKITGKVNGINKREKERRELLKVIWEMGPINPEMLTNSLHLNQTKKKQAPELFKLQEQFSSLYFSYRHGKLIRTHLNHHEFKTCKEVHANSETTLERFESFEEAMEYNDILPKNLTVKQVQKQLDNIKKATDKLNEQADKYSEILKANNQYFLNNEKFISQRHASIYEYSSNY